MNPMFCLHCYYKVYCLINIAWELTSIVSWFKLSLHFCAQKDETYVNFTQYLFSLIYLIYSYYSCIHYYYIYYMCCLLKRTTLVIACRPRTLYRLHNWQPKQSLANLPLFSHVQTWQVNNRHIMRDRV